MDAFTAIALIFGFYVVLPIVAVVFAAMLCKLFVVVLTRW